MNLVEHLIVKIESLDDVTEKYIEYMKEADSCFTIEEKVFKVKLLADCYGHLGYHEMIWRESEFIHYLELGYFMA